MPGGGEARLAFGDARHSSRGRSRPPPSRPTSAWTALPRFISSLRRFQRAMSGRGVDNAGADEARRRPARTTSSTGRDRGSDRCRARRDAARPRRPRARFDDRRRQHHGHAQHRGEPAGRQALVLEPVLEAHDHGVRVGDGAQLAERASVSCDLTASSTTSPAPIAHPVDCADDSRLAPARRGRASAPVVRRSASPRGARPRPPA